MNANLIFALKTLAVWAGGIAGLRALFLLLHAFVGEREVRARLLAPIGVSAAIAAIGLLTGASLEFGKAAGGGPRFPLIWLVMPFTAWVAGVSAAFLIARLVQAGMEASGPDRRRRLVAAATWLAVAVAFGALFAASGDPIELLKGSIPITLRGSLTFLLLVTATFATILFTANRSRARGVAKGIAKHLALLAGSVIFGLPFAWLLITSFKEDRDMSSPSGLVWIPRVQQTVPYFDPEDPIVEGSYEGEPAEGPIIERYSDGSAKVEISRPAVLRGLTFVAKAPLKIVPKQVKVVAADFQGRRIRGRVIKDLEDGRFRVEVMEPASLKGQVFESKPEAVELIRPVGLKWMNYPEALDYLPRETNKGLVYLKNTLILVILNVIGTLLSSSFVAYAFARMRFPGKNALFVILLSTMMLPAAVTLIPQFLIFRTLGWIDTLKPLWVTAFLGSAFNIFLLRQFFMGIPMELEDASKIDGCGYLRAFWQVMLPQVKPALAVVAIWTFMGAWNNFLGPLIYINSPENMPISYALQLFQGDRLSEPGYLMAFATLSMLPVLLVFFFAQKYFIEGVTLSGLGGR